MEFSLDKFLAITAVMAGIGIAACSSTSEEDGSGGDAGTGGGTGGTGAVGGSGGQAGGSGQAGQAGSGGQAGGGGEAGMDGGTDASAGSAGNAGNAGAGGACLDDTTQGDAGMEGLCDTLPYAMTDCDPGSEGGVSPLGYETCWRMSNRLRAGVMEALFACLAEIPTEAPDECSTAHDDAATECYTSTLEAACEQTEAETACTTITTGCSAVDQTSCEMTLNGFLPEAHAEILTCIAGATGTTDPCENIVANCIWDTYYYF